MRLRFRSGWRRRAAPRRQLSLAPILLLPIGGAIGGAFGAAGLFTNLSLARKSLSTPLKALAMLGVALASYLGYILVAGLLFNLINS
ncbi:hypothetical protein [Streptomyces sp. NPDC001591]|uniref:hypothetical protein n=1 Tax=Streptomyces sp. NPDC001591 TaxID=3364589 RepID=UPI00369C9EF6